MVHIFGGYISGLEDLIKEAQEFTTTIDFVAQGDDTEYIEGKFSDNKEAFLEKVQFYYDRVEEKLESVYGANDARGVFGITAKLQEDSRALSEVDIRQWASAIFDKVNDTIPNEWHNYFSLLLLDGMNSIFQEMDRTSASLL